MKFVICLFALVALSHQSEIDWDNLILYDLTPPLFNAFKGLKNKGERIVGGNEAVPNSIRYQVGLFVEVQGGTAFCGGSLISPRYVLTAAHCVDNGIRVRVVLGAHNIRDESEPSRVERFSNEWYIHEDWSPRTLTNDIAVIKIEEVELNVNIELVRLPCRNEENQFAGELGRISGWGLDSDNATEISKILREVNVDIITNRECNRHFTGVIRDTHICTSGSGGRGACSGDSGGPLVTGEKQVGLVSFGLSLGCELGWPSVFTRITNFLDFIEARTDVEIC